jgi:hypothetical protein
MNTERVRSESFVASLALQMPGGPRYQNQCKGISNPRPRRIRSNTIPKANKTIPAETPIMPVTLMTRPIMMSLSTTADLPTITSSARASTVAGTSIANASRGSGYVEKQLRCGQGTLLNKRGLFASAAASFRSSA